MKIIDLYNFAIISSNKSDFKEQENTCMSCVLILARCSPLEAVIIDPECGGMGERDDMVCEGGWILGVFCIMTPVPVGKNDKKIMIESSWRMKIRFG